MFLYSLLKKIIRKLFYLNKLSSYASNFYINRNYINLNTPYDTKSIMHYQSNSFAKFGKYTILSKSEPKVIARNFFITNTDAKEIQLLYSCGTNEFDSILENFSNFTKANIQIQIVNIFFFICLYEINNMI